MDKKQKEILKAFQEGRLGDVITLQNKQFMDKEVGHIKNKIEEIINDVNSKQSEMEKKE